MEIEGDLTLSLYGKFIVNGWFGIEESCRRNDELKLKVILR